MSPDQTSSNALVATGRPDRRGVRRARQRQRLARERIAALGDMTAGLVHDFRNILGVVGSALNLAERNRGDSIKLDAALGAAREGLQRGANLTAKLLTFARPAEQECEPKDINAVLAKIEPLLDFGAGPGVSLSLSLGDDLPKCRVDAPRFGAALLNLVANARDAMTDGGEIRIATSLVQMMESGGGDDVRAVLVRVIDNGPGMSRAVRERIFDPWFTTKSEFGTGLGVPQVAAFMRASGGCINVSSEPGAGTSVDLFFPISQAPGLVGSGLWKQLDRGPASPTRPALPRAGH